MPVDYVVGPGDVLQIQLFGNTKGNYSLIVNRDGNISFPELGPIAVSGLRFEDARAQIQTRVAEQMIGTQVSVAMADLRSIRVFVVGDAVQPGSYTVSGHATITHALFASRRHQAHRVTAQHPAEAQWQARDETGPVRPAAPRRHVEGCAVCNKAT